MKNVTRTTEPASGSYAAPQVVVYGDVLKLTASGTGTQAENTGNTSATRQRP